MECRDGASDGRRARENPQRDVLEQCEGAAGDCRGRPDLVLVAAFVWMIAVSECGVLADLREIDGQEDGEQNSQGSGES